MREHNKPSGAQIKHLHAEALRGVELVDGVARLCCMNLVLHGIGGDALTPVPIEVKDALAAKGDEIDVVLSNPPFGKKSSVTIVNEAGESSRETLIIHRDDFWATTSNKQLNFVQHIFSTLKQHGRAAVVVPDNVLFEGGAGETIRRELLKRADVHTLLRLPTGIFYAQGVKANVIFFDKKPAREKPWTEKLWIYDLRTNMHFTLKENPLKRSDLDEFVKCYNAANRFERKSTWNSEQPPHPSPLPRGEREQDDVLARQEREGNPERSAGDSAGPNGRWRCYSYDELIKRDKASLDIFWLKDDSLSDPENLPPPDVIAQEIMDDLEAALEQMREIAADLNGTNEARSL